MTSDPLLIRALGVTLIQFVLDGLNVWAGTAGLLSLLRASSPPKRYWVAVVALLVATLLPVGRFAVAYDAGPREVASTSGFDSPSLRATAFMSSVLAWEPTAPKRWIDLQGFIESLSRSHSLWISCVWGFGVLLTGARPWWTWRRLRSRLAAEGLPLGEPWPSRASVLGRALRVHRIPRLISWSGTSSPFVV